MKKIKIAIVGAGSMAREHIRAFSAIPNVTIAGIYSRTEAKTAQLAAEFAIPVVAESIQALHAKTQADLVIIAVPELAANQVSKACFAFDWSVLMEKPAGYDLSDAKDIAIAAETNKRTVMVGFNRRFYSSIRIALNDLQQREAERRYIRIEDQQSFAEARKYRHPEDVVEKFMYANSIHMIDLFRVFGRGEVKNISSILPWKGEQSEVVLIGIEFSSGDYGLYQGLWRGPGPWACTVSTPSKRWILQPVEKVSFQNLNERQVQEMVIDTIDKDFKPGFYRQAEEVVKQVCGQDSNVVMLNESLKTMQLIHQMFGV